jgi:Blastomyces yeast-phase-specific protein
MRLGCHFIKDDPSRCYPHKLLLITTYSFAAWQTSQLQSQYKGSSDIAHSFQFDHNNQAMRRRCVLAIITAAAQAAIQVLHRRPAVGWAKIVNTCSFDVYLWAVDQSRNPQTPAIIKPGYLYAEQLRAPQPAGGVSLKLSRNSSLAVITQFEYTFVPSLFTVWYDGSNVNCNGTACPFAQYGAAIIPTDSNCATKLCAAGDLKCRDFYWTWDDNWAVGACGQTANITMTLCTG